MQEIPIETLTEWNKYIGHGDRQRIADESRLSRETISLALSSGKMSTKTAEAIKSFVEKKKELLKA